MQKARTLSRYRVIDATTVEAVAVVDYAERGCSIELANIKACGDNWWSLAFEAFGPDDTLLENLLLVAQRAFAADAVPVLEAAHSFGYAHWLTKLAVTKI